MTFRDVKEYIRYEEIFKNICKASAELRSRMETSALLIVTALERLEAERGPAQREQDKWQGLLVAEEMSGKINPKTAAAAEDAIQKLFKIDQSFKALLRTGGLAIIHLEKRKSDAEIKLKGLLAEQKATLAALDWRISKSNRKARLEKLDGEIKETTEELASIDAILATLKKSRAQNGSLIVIDANTQALADAALRTAVDGYVEINKMKEVLCGKIEAKQEQVEKMKEELLALKEAQNDLNPELIADQFYGSEIEAVFLPEEYEEIRNISDRTSLRNRFMSQIRCRASGIVSK